MRRSLLCCALACALAPAPTRADLLVVRESLDARIIGGPNIIPFSPDFDSGFVFRTEPSPAPIELSDSSGGLAEARAFASGSPFAAELSANARAVAGYFAIVGTGYEVDFVTDESMAVNLTWAFDRLGANGGSAFLYPALRPTDNLISFSTFNLPPSLLQATLTAEVTLPPGAYHFGTRAGSDAGFTSDSGSFHSLTAVTFTPVPEPGAWALLALGGAVMLAGRRLAR